MTENVQRLARDFLALVDKRDTNSPSLGYEFDVRDFAEKHMETLARAVIEGSVAHTAAPGAEACHICGGVPSSDYCSRCIPTVPASDLAALRATIARYEEALRDAKGAITHLGYRVAVFAPTHDRCEEEKAQTNIALAKIDAALAGAKETP